MGVFSLRLGILYKDYDGVEYNRTCYYDVQIFVTLFNSFIFVMYKIIEELDFASLYWRYQSYVTLWEFVFWPVGKKKTIPDKGGYFNPT